MEKRRVKFKIQYFPPIVGCCTSRHRNTKMQVCICLITLGVDARGNIVCVGVTNAFLLLDYYAL